MSLLMHAAPQAHSNSAGGDMAASRPSLVTAYLRDIRPILGIVTEHRQSFIRSIGGMIEGARSGNAGDFAATADQASRDAGSHFRYAAEKLAQLTPPPICRECHDAMASWIEMLAGAADLTGEIGIANEPARVREVQGMMAESRAYSVKFRTQYTNLVEQLRRRGAARAAALAKAQGHRPS